jgi:hypothetical protein
MMHDPDRLVTNAGSSPLSRGPQPGWMTFNEAREHSFTGEIIFETAPEVRAYLDDGDVYYAERDGDPPLGQRLVDAGLLDQQQLDRGTVRVGDVEHLGRIFDRDASVDRDAVVVHTEMATEELVAEVANEVITTVRSTTYRHHPSGVHRWFVTPAEGSSRVPGRPTLDSGLLSEIPGLPLVTGLTVADQLYIEWDEPMLNGMFVDNAVPDLEPSVDDFDESMLQAMLDDSYVPDDGTEMMVQPLVEVTAEVTSMSDHLAFDLDSAFEDDLDAYDDTEDGRGDFAPDDFQIMWPNGDIAAPSSEVLSAPISGAETAPSVEPEAVAEVPDDVTDAVRRAIAALEIASASTGSITSAPPSPVVTPVIEPEVEPLAATEVEPVPNPVAAFSGFAPPSLDMSAEAIYARVAAAEAAANPGGDPGEYAVQVASPVAEPHRDPVAEPGPDERSSALRRLIGSLRRKDR